MAKRAKPPAAAKPKGAGRTLPDQINGLSPAAVRDYLDELHSEFDDAEEASATSRGKINRIYDKACTKLDVSKDALKLLFKEERSQKKKVAIASKMDTRARDSFERLSATMPEGSPMANWARDILKNVQAVAAEATE